MSGEALCCFAFCTFNLCLLKTGRDRGYDVGAYLVLQFKYFSEDTVDTICPKVRARRGIHELCSNPNSFAYLRTLPSST